jgi:hypothetical protein
MSGSSITDDATEDGRWLTYTELARERGISRTSAVRLVRRQRWRRQMGNDGEARVYVLSEHLPGGEPPVMTPVTTTAAGPAAGTAFETALTAIEAAHASEVAALRAQVDTSEQARIAAEQQLRGALELADRSLAQLADATAQIVQAEGRADAAQQRANRAEARADAAEEAVRKAQDAAEALRQSEEARKARGLLARLKAVWRGE